MTRKESTVVVESIIETVITTLRNGDKIEIPVWNAGRVRSAH
jgi:nucleoid DNA-binding protein